MNTSSIDLLTFYGSVVTNKSIKVQEGKTGKWQRRHSVDSAEYDVQYMSMNIYSCFMFYVLCSMFMLHSKA